MKRDSKLEMILLEGPKRCGTYKPEEVLGPYEESLSEAEYRTLDAFLSWVHATNRTYGHGTLHARWLEYWEGGTEYGVMNVHDGNDVEYFTTKELAEARLAELNTYVLTERKI